MPTKKKKTKKPVLLHRRAIGVKLLVGKAPPSARMLYEETWEENNELRTKIAWGNPIRTLTGFTDLNPRSKAEKERCKEELQSRFYIPIQAAALLLQDIEAACVALDQKRGLKEI